jgi:hypothetical protein
MEGFRAPFFWLGILALALAILVEIGSGALLHQVAPAAGTAGLPVGTPGWGIRYLAILDAVLMYGLLTIGLGLFSSYGRAVVGRVQGIVGLLLSLLGLLGAIVLAILAFVLLELMVALLLAVPFGTLAYMLAWGHFEVSSALGTLSLIMFLKLAFCVLILLAHQDFIKNKGLVILAAVSLGLTWLASFLIGLPPSFLASITDVISALVSAIVGAIWLLVLLIASLLAMLKAVRSLRV